MRILGKKCGINKLRVTVAAGSEGVVILEECAMYIGMYSILPRLARCAPAAFSDSESVNGSSHGRLSGITSGHCQSPSQL